jgi:hypothetical protein
VIESGYVLKGAVFRGVMMCSLREPGDSDDHVASIFRVKEETKQKKHQSEVISWSYFCPKHLAGEMRITMQELRIASCPGQDLI